MISRIRSSPYLKLLSMLNSAPSAAFARAKRPPHPAQEKVGLKLIWPMTYSRKLAPRCMSPNCSRAFSPPLASPSIAKASSRPSPRKSPARTASSAPHTHAPPPPPPPHHDTPPPAPLPPTQKQPLQPAIGDPMTLLAVFLDI